MGYQEPIAKNASGGIYNGTEKGQMFYWNGRNIVRVSEIMWDDVSKTFKIDGDLELVDTVYEDLLGSALQLEVQGSGLSINVDENTLDYLTSSALNDYGFDNYQMRHAWKIGTTIYPHIHWEQAEDNVPNWLIQYRWQVQGQAKTTAWTNYLVSSLVFEYSSGTLNQISDGPGLTPPEGAGLSDIIQFRIIRDTANDSGEFSEADPYTKTASISFVDIHIEENSTGSDEQYIK